MELYGNFELEPRSDLYKYNIMRVVKWEAHNKVIKVAGKHLKNKNHENLDEISFTDMGITRFPLQMGNIFPNLTILTMNGCALQNLTKFDLKGMKNLKQLSFNGNQITSLSDGLFDETPNLEFISFYGNKVQFIGLNIFDKLPNLRYANFKMNTNIDACYKIVGKGVSLEYLKAIIRVDCQRSSFEDIENYFHELKIAYDRGMK